MDGKKLGLAALDCIDLEKLIMDVGYDMVIEDVLLEKVKEVIPGDVDDAIIDGVKPMARPIVKGKVAELVAELKASLAEEKAAE